MYTDSHAHLDDARFSDDIDEVIAKLKESKISLVVNIGADLESSKRSVALAKKHDFIYAAVGVHPEDVGNMTESALDTLETLARHEKVVAIGEIGLDYFYEDNPPPDMQKEWFYKQALLAKKLELPIVIHNRDAHEDCLGIVEKSACCGVFHCFSGDAKMAKRVTELGFYVSFAGNITYKKSQNLVEAAKVIPIDRLLIETDSPYLAPEGYRGKRNDPALVRIVAEKIAEIRGMSVKEIARITTENAKRLYRIN